MGLSDFSTKITSISLQSEMLANHNSSHAIPMQFQQSNFKRFKLYKRHSYKLKQLLSAFSAFLIQSKR